MECYTEHSQLSHKVNSKPHMALTELAMRWFLMKLPTVELSAVHSTAHLRPTGYTGSINSSTENWTTLLEAEL